MLLAIKLIQIDTPSQETIFKGQKKKKKEKKVSQESYSVGAWQIQCEQGRQLEGFCNCSPGVSETGALNLLGLGKDLESVDWDKKEC